MSLINQMLKDLDKRRSADEPALGDIQPAMGKVRRASMWVIAPLALVGLSVLAWMTFVADERETRHGTADGPVSAIEQTLLVEPPIVVMSDAALHTVPRPPAPRESSAPSASVPPVEDRWVVEAQTESPEQEAVEPEFVTSEPVLFASLEPPPVIKRPTTSSPTEQAVRAVERARAHVRAGKLREAERTLRDACALWSGQSEAWSLLATLLTSQGRNAEASAVLREGLKNVDHRGPLAKMLARQLLHEDQSIEALAVLREHHSEVVDDAEYEALLAALLQRDGSHAEALELYRDLVNRDAPRVEWWLGLAVTNDQLGDVPAALAAYRRVEVMPGLSGRVRNYVAARVAALAEQSSDSDKP